MTSNIRNKDLYQIEKKLSGFVKLLDKNISSQMVGKKIEKFKLIEKIKNLENYGIEALRAVPHLLRIINDDRTHKYLDLLSVIVKLIGRLKPDGLITEETFRFIVINTPFKQEEILSELRKRKYIEESFLTPKFCPSSSGFKFEINSKYEPLKEEIKNALLNTSLNISTTHALLDLLKNNSLSKIHSDIMFALGEIGHPIILPILIERSQTDSRSNKIIIKMVLKDIKELILLLSQGVKKDVWGKDLNEKIIKSYKSIIPLLLETVSSKEYEVADRWLICFLLNEFGISSKEDIKAIIELLPELIVDDYKECYVTKIIIRSGNLSLPYIIQKIEEDKCKPDVLKRYIFILGQIGFKAKDSVEILRKLLTNHPDLEIHIIEAIDKIEPDLLSKEEKDIKSKQVQKDNLNDIDKEETNSPEEKYNGANDIDPEEFVLL